MKKLRTLRKGSYNYEALEFLYKNKDKSYAWIDFIKSFSFIRKLPFLWQEPSARLCTLQEMWLLKKVWERKGKLQKTQPAYLYQINEAWIDYFNKLTSNEEK